MKNIFSAFLYKVRKDISVRITLFIGLGFAILIPLIFFLLDLGISAIGDEGVITHNFATGQSLLISSFSPTQNFGLAIPINLITFTVLEFTNGTIRNKIISGYSKGKIFFGLYITGLCYTFALILSYVLLCFGFGCAYGGFNPNGAMISLASLGGGNITPEFIWKFIVLALLAYAVITSIAVFFASLFRHVGPCIPVVIIILLMFSGMASIVGTVNLLVAEGEDMGFFGDFMKNLCVVLKAINPIHSILVFDSKSTFDEATSTVTTIMSISWQSFITQVINNIIYIGIFFGFGLLIFTKRDVK